METKIKMSDQVAMSIGHNVDIAESFGMKGNYALSCVGPREEIRSEYLTLRDRMEAMQAQRNPVRLTPAFIHRVSDGIMLPRNAVQSLLIAPDGIEYLLRCMEEQKWEEVFKNLVTDEGANFFLNTVWGSVGYTATVYMGLISSATFTVIALTNTAAQINGANQWREAGPANAPNYSQASRPAMTFAAAAGRSKSLSTPCVFSMNAVGTLKGSFAATSSTKQGTTGTLISAGLFTSADRTTAIGDTVNGSYTSTAG